MGNHTNIITIERRQIIGTVEPSTTGLDLTPLQAAFRLMAEAIERDGNAQDTMGFEYQGQVFTMNVETLPQRSTEHPCHHVSHDAPNCKIAGLPRVDWCRECKANPELKTTKR